jgi:hypothetical protein
VTPLHVPDRFTLIIFRPSNSNGARDNLKDTIAALKKRLPIPLERTEQVPA